MCFHAKFPYKTAVKLITMLPARRELFNVYTKYIVVSNYLNPFLFLFLYRCKAEIRDKDQKEKKLRSCSFSKLMPHSSNKHQRHELPDQYPAK